MNNRTEEKEYWETESYPIAIDSCCSVSIAKQREDFVGNMQECDITIQGFSGKSKITTKGTWKFKIRDDMGTEYEILIPDMLIATEAPYHLLSPQHWEQQSKDPDGTYFIIKKDKMIIKWHGGTFTRQVKLDKTINVDSSAHHLPIRNISTVKQQ